MVNRDNPPRTVQSISSLDDFVLIEGGIVCIVC
jgi:hypothetical protein